MHHFIILLAAKAIIDAAKDIIELTNEKKTQIKPCLKAVPVLEMS